MCVCLLSDREAERRVEVGGGGELLLPHRVPVALTKYFSMKLFSVFSPELCSTARSVYGHVMAGNSVLKVMSFKNKNSPFFFF